MATKALEDELDQALRDLEFDDATPSLPVDPVEPELPSGFTNSANELIDLDFGVGTDTSDGFEEARAEERAAAALLATPIHDAPQRGLAARLLEAKHGKVDVDGDGSEAANRRGKFVLALVLLFGLLTFFESSGSHLSTGGAGGRSVTALCSSIVCNAETKCAAGLSPKGHVWSTTDTAASTHGIALLAIGYNPSKNSIDRLLKMAASIQSWNKAHDPKIEFWVSIDNSFSHNSTTTLIKELETQKARLIIGRDIHLHEFVGEDAMQRYPSIKSVPYCRVDKNQKFHIAASTPPNSDCEFQSATQVEAILMWWKHEKVIQRQYKSVWIIDDDVGYTGNIAEFISDQNEIEADLLTYEGCNRVSDKIGEKSTSSFLAAKHAKSKLYSSDFFRRYSSRYFSLEYVQRISSQLLNEMDDCSSRGVTADRTEFACTVAENSGFTYQGLDSYSIGAPYTKWDPEQLTEESWASKQSQTGKFFHPLKF